jgi:hypothetical protein
MSHGKWDVRRRELLKLAVGAMLVPGVPGSGRAQNEAPRKASEPEKAERATQAARTLDAGDKGIPDRGK